MSDANRLRGLDNCYVTTGRTIRKRPGLTRVVNFEPGTKGLRAASGKLNTFYASGSITHADTRFLANKIAHPSLSSMEVDKIHYADSFNGYLYVSAQYLNGDIRHHYLDGTSPTHVTDVNCPHTIVSCRRRLAWARFPQAWWRLVLSPRPAAAPIS